MAPNPRTAHLRMGLALPLPDQREQRRVPQLGHKLCMSGLSLSYRMIPMGLEGRKDPGTSPKQDAVGSVVPPQIHMLNP